MLLLLLQLLRLLLWTVGPAPKPNSGVVATIVTEVGKWALWMCKDYRLCNGQSTRYWKSGPQRIPAGVIGWPINDDHVVKWYIYLVWYLLGCSHCRWVNQLEEMCGENAVQALPSQNRPLHLCMSEKLHVFHDDGCPHFPTEGSVKLSWHWLNYREVNML